MRDKKEINTKCAYFPNEKNLLQLVQEKSHYCFKAYRIVQTFKLQKVLAPQLSVICRV